MSKGGRRSCNTQGRQFQTSIGELRSDGQRLWWLSLRTGPTARQGLHRRRFRKVNSRGACATNPLRAVSFSYHVLTANPQCERTPQGCSSIVHSENCFRRYTQFLGHLGACSGLSRHLVFQSRPGKHDKWGELFRVEGDSQDGAAHRLVAEFSIFLQPCTQDHNRRGSLNPRRNLVRPGDVVCNGSESDCERQTYSNPTRYPNESPGSTASHLFRRSNHIGSLFQAG